MGVVANIDYDRYPKQNQSELYGVGARVRVCYRYDTTKCHDGTIVRCDEEAPYETIIQLDNGWFLRACECHYCAIDSKEADP